MELLLTTDYGNYWRNFDIEMQFYWNNVELIFFLI